MALRKKYFCIPLLLFLLTLLFMQTAFAAFSDVSSSAGYYDAVIYLNQAGVLSGRGDGTFDPDGPTTRAEFCAFVARAEGFHGSGGADTQFADVSTDYWAGSVIRYCAQKGYVSGVGGGRFEPARKIKQEEAVKVAVSAAGLDNGTLSAAGSSWYSGYIAKAQEQGFLSKLTVSPGKDANRAFVAQLLYNGIRLGFFNNGGTSEPGIPPATQNPDGPVIVIDAGHNHSTTDTGASANGLLEQDVTFQIAEKVRPLLERCGFHVILTRNAITDSLGTTTKESLQARCDIANDAGAQAFISIHCNSGGGTGTETYCLQFGSSAEQLARAVHQAILSEVGTRDRKVRERSLYVLEHTAMPAILVETGFLDSEEDAAHLSSDAERQKFAVAIAKGVCSYLGIAYVG